MILLFPLRPQSYLIIIFLDGSESATNLLSHFEVNLASKDPLKIFSHTFLYTFKAPQTQTGHVLKLDLKLISAVFSSRSFVF